jgi:hypothetical protein
MADWGHGDAADENGLKVVNRRPPGTQKEKIRWGVHQWHFMILDAVYIDTKNTKSVIAIKPKPPFKPVFQVAVSRKGSNINIVSEPLKGSSLFVVETGEGWSLPETMLCFV